MIFVEENAENLSLLKEVLARIVGQQFQCLSKSHRTFCLFIPSLQTTQTLEKYISVLNYLFHLKRHIFDCCDIVL